MIYYPKSNYFGGESNTYQEVRNVNPKAHIAVLHTTNILPASKSNFWPNIQRKFL